MSNISKSFGSNLVLDEVNFELNESEIVALLGANGAGKSTLMKIMTGIYAKDEGQIELKDKIVNINSPSEAMGHKIRLVPQELQILPDLSVAENIFLGLFPAHGNMPLSRLNRKEMHSRSKEILNELGINNIDVTAKITNYSVSEQRLIEIARALVGDAKILVMDEPTASLSEPECKRLFEIMRRLKSRGVSIIFISHFLDEVFQICDRIEVLRDGVNAGSFATTETDTHEVLSAMLGKELSDLFPDHAKNPTGEAFKVDKLSLIPRINEISFEVKKGEIYGIFGLIGSGIEELGKALFTSHKNRSGSLSLMGEPFTPSNVSKAIKQGVGFVSGERKSEGIIPDQNLRDSFTLPFLGRHTKGLTMSVASQDSFAQKWIKALGVITSGTSQKISGLSGGNQQKICIGRWLVGGLKVLILEEPTRGVDLGARKDIYRHLRDLSDEGLAIVVISTDAEEIGGLADRSTVLIDGFNAKNFDEPVDAKTIMHAATREKVA